jgi:Dolichyl-phosphate-mannose-protein mannosyltransferase
MRGDQPQAPTRGIPATWWRIASRSDLAPIAALVALSSFALTHLMAVPAFEDEGTQLRLIWRVIEAGEWLQPLSEGKPLEAWPMVPLGVLASQPLLAIRALHVLSGMFGAVLMYRLVGQIADRRTAFASGVLFVICPFVVYLERLAHSDILMCTAGLWVLLNVVRLLDAPTWGRATALAVALVLSALCKLPVGFVFLASLPLALLIMPANDRRSVLRRGRLQMLVAHVPAVLLALVVLTVAVVRVERGLLPGFGLQDLIGIGLGRYDDIATVIGVPRPSLWGELTAQLSWPVVGLGLVGLAASALLGDWRERWLIVVGGAPMLAIGWLTAYWFSRYLLFTLPPLIIAAACGWRRISVRVPRYPWLVGAVVFALSAAFMVPQSVRLIVDPLTARWSPLDRFQYFEAWASGYGYPEAAQFLLSAAHAPRMIYALDGHSAYQLRTYLPAAWGARVQPVVYGDDGKQLRTEQARLDHLLRHSPAWIVVSDQVLPWYLKTDFGARSVDRLKLREIARFSKPGTRAQVVIYEVTGS